MEYRVSWENYKGEKFYTITNRRQMLMEVADKSLICAEVKVERLGC